MIYSGRSRLPVIGRWLAHPRMVYIGLISYSLYLWHWPLLIFARLAYGGELTWWLTLSVVFVSVILATLSLRFVERPFRGSGALLTSSEVFRFSALGMSVFVAIGLHGMWTKGWSARFPPEVAAILFAEKDRDPRQHECLNTRDDANGCVYGEAGQPPAVALWGDSHASVYSVMLGELAAERNQSVRVFTMPACPPLIGWTDSGQAWREQCERFQALAFEELRASPSIHTVMLAGRFAGYPHDQPDSGFSAAMRGTIEALRSAGKWVALVYPAPELGAHVPEVLSRSIMAGESPEEKAQPRSRFEETFKRELDFLNRLVDEEGVLDIRPDRRLCDAESCYFYKDGVVYYYDDNHLSLSGAEIAKPEFRAVFDPPDRAASEPPGGPVRR